VLTLIAARHAGAQTTLPQDLLRDLPNGGNVFALLETTDPEIVTERFNSAGLNVGEPSRVAGFFSSSRQTRYRVGDVDITSAVDGTPLLFPHVAWWDGIGISSRAMSADAPGPSLSIALQPAGMPRRWTTAFETLSSTYEPAAIRDPAPAVSRLQHWRTATAMIAGPISQRAGLRAGVVFSSNATFQRDEAAAAVRRLASLFARTTYTIAGRDELSVLSIVDRGPHDASHAQGSWLRRAGGRERFRAAAGYTSGSRSAREPGPVIDRLTDGPVPLVAAERDRTERVWSLSARLSPPTWLRGHDMTLGGAALRASVTEAALEARTIGETIDGIPARLWEYGPRGESRRHAVSVALFATDRMAWTRIALDVGLRYEHQRGKAEGAFDRTASHALLPSARLVWRWGTPLDLTFAAGARRADNRLTLDLFTVGDRASPLANVYRWSEGASLDARGALVARVGPGATEENPDVSRLDRGLRPSRVDEFTIGVTSAPRGGLSFTVEGVTRRQTRIIRLENVGVPLGAYNRLSAPDDNVDLARPEDDQQLVVYERQPGSFGEDRYVLANARGENAVMGALVIGAQVSSQRVRFAIGATAAAAVGAGGNRGFRIDENDQDALGEVSIDPNASTNARGRLFSDRAYTIKTLLVCRFPRGIRLGLVARYQDGQPFTRMVLVADLNQGTDLVQAFPRGRSRFAFTGTLDLRLAKGIRLGAAQVDVLLDAYNLAGMRKEVEEYVVTGPRFRDITAVQPPRSVHVGARVSF
jgi:hypothetical protein